jgi:serine phosphatase RsbU (regulator of sigma subunit)
LGQDPNALFHADSLCLESGDSLIIYTDGLFENQGPESKTLSRRVLTKSLNSEDEALHTLNNILSLARNIWKNHPPDDDVTLLVLKWHYLENYVTSVA